MDREAWQITVCGVTKSWQMPRAPHLIVLTTPWRLVQGEQAGSGGKESTCNAGDLGSISGSGRSPGEGNDNPLQYPCLENSMDGEAWQVTV